MTHRIILFVEALLGQQVTINTYKILWFLVNCFTSIFFKQKLIIKLCYVRRLVRGTNTSFSVWFLILSCVGAGTASTGTCSSVFINEGILFEKETVIFREKICNLV